MQSRNNKNKKRGSEFTITIISPDSLTDDCFADSNSRQSNPLSSLPYALLPLFKASLSLTCLLSRTCLVSCQYIQTNCAILTEKPITANCVTHCYPETETVTRHPAPGNTLVEQRVTKPGTKTITYCF